MRLKEPEVDDNLASSIKEPHSIQFVAFSVSDWRLTGTRANRMTDGISAASGPSRVGWARERDESEQENSEYLLWPCIVVNQIWFLKITHTHRLTNLKIYKLTWHVGIGRRKLHTNRRTDTMGSMSNLQIDVEWWIKKRNNFMFHWAVPAGENNRTGPGPLVGVLNNNNTGSGFYSLLKQIHFFPSIQARNLFQWEFSDSIFFSLFPTLFCQALSLHLYCLARACVSVSFGRQLRCVLLAILFATTLIECAFLPVPFCVRPPPCPCSQQFDHFHPLAQGKTDGRPTIPNRNSIRWATRSDSTRLRSIVTKVSCPTLFIGDSIGGGQEQLFQQWSGPSDSR